jgi:hypothetical protein
MANRLADLRWGFGLYKISLQEMGLSMMRTLRPQHTHGRMTAAHSFLLQERISVIR